MKNLEGYWGYCWCWVERTIFFVSWFPHFGCSVFVYTWSQPPTINEEFIRLTLPWRAAIQTIPFLVGVSVWLTWPETAVSLLSLQLHVHALKMQSWVSTIQSVVLTADVFQFFQNNSTKLLCFLHPSISSKHYIVQHTQSVSMPIRHPSDKESSV